MKTVLFYLVLYGVLLEVICINDKEIVCNNKTILKMDYSITKLIVVGQKNLKFPTNAKQVRPYCNLAKKTFDLAAAFSDKCLPAFGRDTAKVFMHPIGNELNGVCKAGRLSKRARELLGAANCANAGLKNWQKCNLELINKFTGIVNAPIKKRIPMGCCNFHQLVYCLTEEAENVKQCTRKTIDFVLKYVHKIIDPLIGILCNQYSEPSDICDAMVKVTPNRTADQPKYKSFLVPLLNIATSLGEKLPD